MKWSSSGTIAGKHCVRILETVDPHTWGDNFLCFNQDYGVVWSSSGTIAGKKCTQLLEPSDPHTGTDNFLCVPNLSTFEFAWSSSGPIKNLFCTQMLEAADPNTWSDNYVCLKESVPVCGTSCVLINLTKIFNLRLISCLLSIQYCPTTKYSIPRSNSTYYKFIGREPYHNRATI